MGLGEIRLGEMGLGEMGLGEMGQNLSEIWPFEKMAAGRHLEFDPTGNGAVRSAVPENPTLEPNMKGSVDALQSYGHLKFLQNV